MFAQGTETVGQVIATTDVVVGLHRLIERGLRSVIGQRSVIGRLQASGEGPQGVTSGTVADRHLRQALRLHPGLPGRAPAQLRLVVLDHASVDDSAE